LQCRVLHLSAITFQNCVGFLRRRHRSLWALVPFTGNMTISKKCQKNSPNVSFKVMAIAVTVTASNLGFI
jgi:hypothetical protein